MDQIISVRELLKMKSEGWIDFFFFAFSFYILIKSHCQLEEEGYVHFTQKPCAVTVLRKKICKHVLGISIKHERVLIRIQ